VASAFIVFSHLVYHEALIRNLYYEDS